MTALLAKARRRRAPGALRGRGSAGRPLGGCPPVPGAVAVRARLPPSWLPTAAAAHPLPPLPAGPSPPPLFPSPAAAQACGVALEQHPLLYAACTADGSGVTYNERINIAMAVRRCCACWPTLPRPRLRRLCLRPAQCRLLCLPPPCGACACGDRCCA